MIVGARMLRLSLRMRGGELDRSVAVDTARAEIATRIRHVCQNFNEYDFQRLVERMAEIEVRYRLRDQWGLFRSRTPRSAMN